MLVLYFSFEVSAVVTTHNLNLSRPTIFWYLNVKSFVLVQSLTVGWHLRLFQQIFNPLFTFEVRTSYYSIKT